MGTVNFVAKRCMQRKKLCNLLGVSVSKFDVIELSEAFAAHELAVIRQLGLNDEAKHVNPNGGVIA